MTPLKDTLEVVESAAPQGSTVSKADAGQFRADAVSLDVSVKIHGSRVTDVVLGVTQHTEPFEEQTSTLIVFPQGGVLRMSTVVNVGQVVVLTNVKSGKDAICRVAKVRACPNNQNYVEVEFTHRQPGYWGVQFSSEVDDLPKKSASVEVEAAPVPSSRVSVIRHAESSANAAKSSVTPPEKGMQTGLIESSFISIGSQENVQPAATSPTAVKGGDPFAIGAADRSVSGSPRKATVASFPAPAPPAAPQLRSVADLRRDVLGAPPASSPNASIGAPVTELTGDEIAPDLLGVAQPAAGIGRSSSETFGSMPATAAPQSGSRQLFASHLESTASGSPEQSAGARTNWVLIAACAAVVLVVAAAGAFYFRGSHSSPAAASKSAPSDATQAVANSASQTPQQANMVASSSPSHLPTAHEVVVVHADPAPEKAAKVAPSKPSEAAQPVESVEVAPASAPPAPVKAQPSRPISDLFGALNAHPASASRSSSIQPVAAPSLDSAPGSAADSNTLSSVPQAMSALPKPVSDGPLEVGGNVLAPRLISSVPPVYPALAIQTQVSGIVVMEAVIDKSGNVSEAKVVSGPQLLRVSALDALKHWKYQPSIVGGQPVSIRMSVAIQFRR